MPDPNEIKRRFNGLPTKPLYQIAEQHEVWESIEAGAHFIVSKERMPLPLVMTVCSLSVSGQVDAVTKVIADFSSVFGEPAGRHVVEDPRIEFVLWDSSVLKQKPS